MEKFVYQQLAELEENNWWYRGRKKIILAFLNHLFKGKTDLKILDAGCGAGSVMKLLAQYGRVTGVDKFEPLVKYCRIMGKKVILDDICHLSFSDNRFDLVVALEILEHVEDDRRALGELYRVVKKDGILFLSVPAFPFLWGNQDLAAKHRRRYTKNELADKLGKSGFSIIKITYMNFFLFPLIAFFRIVRKIFSKQKPRLDSSYFAKIPWFNSIFSFILGSEAFLFSRFNLPFGVTLICVAKK